MGKLENKVKGNKGNKLEKEVIVKSIELDEKKKGYLKVTFDCDFGEYPLHFKKRYKKFWPGDKFHGLLAPYPSSLPDFKGDKVEEQTVATASYQLVQIKDRFGTIIYKK